MSVQPTLLPKIRGLRWWMISLLMLGSIVNYLTRSSLAGAAPTLKDTLHITEQNYAGILNTFQIALLFQPLCGYLMDAIGLKLAFGIFAVTWSLISMAHGFAHSWRALAALRGGLGLVEGSANPAGMKATAEWIPAKERGFAGGLFNIGASVGSMLAPPLVGFAILKYNGQAAFVITGVLGLGWSALWWLFYHPPAKHPELSDEERAHIAAGQENTSPAMAHGRRSSGFCGREISGGSRCRDSSPIQRGARSPSGVAGLAGTRANLGVFLFNFTIGTLVATIGYTPFFICLSALDIVGAVVLWTFVREKHASA